MKHQERRKGSITVEAVFLIPILLGVLFFLLWLVFFMHDRLVIRGVIHQTLECADDYLIYGTGPKNGDLPEEEITNRGLFYAFAALGAGEKKELEEYAYSLLQDKLYLYRLREIRLEQSGFMVQLSVESDYPILWMAERQKEITLRDEKTYLVREELTRISSNLMGLKNGEWAWE